MVSEKGMSMQAMWYHIMGMKQRLWIPKIYFSVDRSREFWMLSWGEMTKKQMWVLNNLEDLCWRGSSGVSEDILQDKSHQIKALAVPSGEMTGYASGQEAMALSRL